MIVVLSTVVYQFIYIKLTILLTYFASEVYFALISYDQKVLTMQAILELKLTLLPANCMPCLKNSFD